MKASSREALPRFLTSSLGAPTASTRPRCISEIRSQRSASFMKWVERKIDAVIAGEIDQRAPERVARDRIDARSRLVEDEKGRPVQHRHGELQPLLDAERQAFRPRVRHVLQIVPLQQLLDPASDLICRQMVETRMQIEILPNGELAVERKRLRHVADVAPRLHVVGAHRLSEQFRRAFGYRQEPRQHLHGGCLAAAVRTEEAKDLAARDAKADMVDGDEIAKAAGQAIRFDRRGLISADGARTHDDFLMLGALFRWEKGNEGVIQRGLLRFGEDLLRRATRDDLAIVHGGKPVEPAGLVHIGRRDDHAHGWTPGSDRIDQLPELPARERIDAGRRLVENEQVRIVHQRAAEADFLLHAARELAARPASKRIETRRRQENIDARSPLGSALPEQAAEEVDVVEHAERRIEIAAQPLRHISDTTVTGSAMRGVCHVSVQHRDFAGLDLAHPGDEAEQGGLADAIGPDHSHHAAGGNIEGEVVEREPPPVAVRYPFDPGDNGIGHWGSFTTSSSGHAILGSVRTKPRPRTPVFTCRWYLSKTFGSPWSLTRNISFCRSSAVSTLFGVNWASVATKLIVAGMTYWGMGSAMTRASSPSVSLPASSAGR